ncbi:protein PSK SIMULATOR 3-like [Gossypium arboreum]|uniref:protein PSK SIMULATOR 3-like n=1 Tax=Gossypium arboreum TaxID=29729 RepID=UPI000819354A|nr:protein PSK SIMULATOR 3-like [Gossypium arboreum]
MGGICSRSGIRDDGVGNAYGGGDFNNNYQTKAVPENSLMNPPQVTEIMEKRIEEPTDDFYDGIPRFTRGMSQKSRSVRSTQAAVAKVSEVGSRLGKAGSVGLGKAVEVLDTLGSSMTSLNPNAGFASGVATKGNELTILAFEVANTIVKGSNLMQSLSRRNVRHLKEVVLATNGVQNLISKDMDELLRIVAVDKREELKIFSGEVVRFGNRSKDRQWHSLERYFEKISRELSPQKQLKEEAELLVEQLMISVQYTAELYQELQILDKFEQDYLRKRQEEDNSAGTQKGDSLAILKADLKSQRKQVRNLKKKSLWSRSLEEVMEKLVDIVHYLILEIHCAFGSNEYQKSPEGSESGHQRLGPAGLALHYANIIMQVDTLVARSSSIPANTREALYQNLPPSIKSALRPKLRSFHVKEELTVTEVKDEMEKTLQWLVPLAANTTKAHHGFGWVGEWANTGSELNKKPSTGPADAIRIETLHHADKEKTETYILEQLLWLHYLVNKSKSSVALGLNTSTKTQVPSREKNKQPKPESFTAQIPEEEKLLQDLTMKVGIQGISRSLDFDCERRRLRKHDCLSKSTGHSPPRVSKEKGLTKRLPSGVPIIAYGMYKEKALDVIDRVDSLS